jgi:hypothetical protein
MNMSTPKVPVHISYNAEDDYLEVVFSDSVGRVEASEHPSIDQSIDKSGAVVGFWIKDISKLSKFGFLNVRLESLAVSDKAYDVNEIRKVHPNAYAKWSAEEDQRLTSAYKAGESVASLAISHNRNRGAITSRLRKLGLDQP